LKCSNQGAQSRREDDQITGASSNVVSMGFAGRNKYRSPWTGDKRSVSKTEMEFAFQDVPSLIVSVVNVQNCWPATAPFVNTK